MSPSFSSQYHLGIRVVICEVSGDTNIKTIEDPLYVCQIMIKGITQFIRFYQFFYLPYNYIAYKTLMKVECNKITL